MNTTIPELARRIRSIVNDRDLVNTSGLRYSDDDIADALTQGYANVWAYRPDAVLSQLPESPVISAADVTDVDQVSPVGKFYDEPVVFYSAGFLSLRDDEHVNSNRATGLFAASQARMIGG